MRADLDSLVFGDEWVNTEVENRCLQSSLWCREQGHGARLSCRELVVLWVTPALLPKLRSRRSCGTVGGWESGAPGAKAGASQVLFFLINVS